MRRLKKIHDGPCGAVGLVQRAVAGGWQRAVEPLRVTGSNQIGVKAGDLAALLQQRIKRDGLAGGRRLGRHVDGIVGRHDRIGAGEHPEIGVLALPVPDHRVWQGGAQDGLGLRPCAARRGYDEAGAGGEGREVGSKFSPAHGRDLFASGVAAQQDGHEGPAQMREFRRPLRGGLRKFRGGDAAQRTEGDVDVSAGGAVMRGNTQEVKARVAHLRFKDLYPLRARFPRPRHGGRGAAACADDQHGRGQRRHRQPPGKKGQAGGEPGTRATKPQIIFDNVGVYAPGNTPCQPRRQRDIARTTVRNGINYRFR